MQFLLEFRQLDNFTQKQNLNLSLIWDPSNLNTCIFNIYRTSGLNNIYRQEKIPSGFFPSGYFLSGFIVLQDIFRQDIFRQDFFRQVFFRAPLIHIKEKVY